MQLTARHYNAYLRNFNWNNCSCERIIIWLIYQRWILVVIVTIKSFQILAFCNIKEKSLLSTTVFAYFHFLSLNSLQDGFRVKTRGIIIVQAFNLRLLCEQRNCWWKHWLVSLCSRTGWRNYYVAWMIHRSKPTLLAYVRHAEHHSLIYGLLSLPVPGG